MTAKDANQRRILLYIIFSCLPSVIFYFVPSFAYAYRDAKPSR